MLKLPNGCLCSKPAISPKNWHTKKAPIKKAWFIHYRFYDLAANKKKQVIIKGFNEFSELADRQDAAKKMLAYELDLLLNQGYNPITKKCTPPVLIDYIIDPYTPFIQAMQKTIELLKIEENTKKDMRKTVAACSKAAAQLDFHQIAIKDIRRRHLKLMLEQCSENSARFSANTFNHYRKYLSMIFSELVELEAVEHNYVSDIKKQRVLKKIRLTLTEAERKKVNEHLQQYPSFHRFMHIFFHSGARETELMRLQAKYVDLANQRYKCVIKKGGYAREVYRTIKDIALPLWQELLNMAGPDDYLFSKGLVPGPTPIRVDQITKRWYRLVKQKLGIESDFYALKHLHTSEIVDLLGDVDAAKMNEHTSTAMVVKIYDTKREQRQHERLKGAGNIF